jgi:hypothetical protein
MTAENFVELLCRQVDVSADDLLSLVGTSAKNRDNDFRLRRAEWIERLTNKEREYLRSIVTRSVDAGLYWFVSALDGAVAFDPKRGSLELTYRDRDGSGTLINSPNGEPLNEIMRDPKFQRP